MKHSNSETTPLKTASHRIALIGNPNCGKTTLFNQITGTKQKVGNWPGVTVERKSGYFNEGMTTIEVIDLPGLYSLTLPHSAAMDERITADVILNHGADFYVNIVDASHLERHLYLTMQLIDMNVPIILVLNMMDVAKERGIHIDVAALSKQLGCVVVPLSAIESHGIHQLKKIISHPNQKTNYPRIPYSNTLEQAINELSIHADRASILRLLENDVNENQIFNSTVKEGVKKWQNEIAQIEGEDSDILIAEHRYQRINQILSQHVVQGEKRISWTDRIDAIVLNRILGLPIFFGIMYALFFFSINIGGAFQDFFDLSTQAVFVDGFAYVLAKLHLPTWFIVLMANGVGKGINTTSTFIPVIGALFLFLSFLEDSGYMARAAFVVDRLMRALGLPGKAFVPMIVGFGCNVPAVMGARTLENKRDRILTIMMAPFMSCGARLAIFAVFTSAFFPQNGQNIVFTLYLIGILMAVMTGFILRRTVLKGEPSPLIMELPAYHWPRSRAMFLHAWQRLKGFVIRSGRLIIPICVLIGALNSLNLDGTINTGEGDAHSLLSLIGQWATPLFYPMGITADNWPATVGLATGVLAKEVVIGSLNTLYSQLGHLTVIDSSSFNLWSGLNDAWQSIFTNFAALRDAFTNPVLAKAPIDPVNQGVLGLMYQKFAGKAGAFAYLLFILLYFPCISTTAVMLRELHRGWAIFSAFWMTGIAYAAAVVFYQAATWYAHPTSSTIWIAAMSSLFLATIFSIRRIALNSEQPAQIPVGSSIGEVA
jgi:ferrous iron transport protein B